MTFCLYRVKKTWNFEILTRDKNKSANEHDVISKNFVKIYSNYALYF